MRYALILALALAAPAQAQDTKGFTAGDLSAAARAGRPSPALADMREFAAQTEVVRAGFVLDPAGAWGLLSPSEARTLHVAFGPQRPTGDDAIQWFMRGAEASAGNGDMTGLYNPLADVWLVLRWDRIGGRPRIADAVFLPGSAVNGGGGQTWTQSPGPYADALARNAAVAHIAFALLDSGPFFDAFASVKTPASDQAYQSVTAWMGSLRPWGEDKARLKQWQALHRDLAEGKTGGTVAALPPKVRATLVPMGAITSADGPALLLVSPLAPQMVVAADYNGHGRPKLSLINLANAGGAQ